MAFPVGDKRLPPGDPGDEVVMAGSQQNLALVVDDLVADRKLACSLIQSELGWRTCEAADGCAAMAAIAEENPHVVVTTLHMPDCDGLELVDLIRRSHPTIPVILMTEVGSEKMAMQALQRGAASYVPKAELESALADSLEQVVSASKAAQNRRRLLGCLRRVELEYELENDATLIPALVAQIQDHLVPLQLCDQNSLIRIGVALEEAILNAMYHGNLEVSSQLRQVDESHFHKLIEERKQLAPYRDRILRIEARLSPYQAVFVIADQGKGFDPSTLPDPTDLSNLDRIGGRGLLLIRTFMDDVQFNSEGNQITMLKRRHDSNHKSI